MPIQQILASLVVTLHMLSAMVAQTADAASVPRISSTTPLTTVQDISMYIRQEAEDYGVDPDMAMRVATKESGLDPNAIGDGGFAIGIFQVRLDFHKHVTKDEMLNPTLNIDWSMKQMAHDHGCRLWSTCYDK